MSFLIGWLGVFAAWSLFAPPGDFKGAVSMIIFFGPPLAFLGALFYVMSL